MLLTRGSNEAEVKNVTGLLRKFSFSIGIFSCPTYHCITRILKEAWVQAPELPFISSHLRVCSVVQGLSSWIHTYILTASLGKAGINWDIKSSLASSWGDYVRDTKPLTSKSLTALFQNCCLFPFPNRFQNPSNSKMSKFWLPWELVAWLSRYRFLLPT